MKPNAPLIGADSNVFSLLGVASRALKDNGMYLEAEEMRDRVLGADSYPHALLIMQEYVTPVSDEWDDDDEEWDEYWDELDSEDE